jgi:hypothetical protein
MGIPTTNHRDGKALKQPVQGLLSASVIDFVMAVALRNLNNFKINFRTIKLLCVMV